MNVMGDTAAGEHGGALDDIRVLDLTGVMGEPTGRVLCDLGAEVIKIEPPGGCESRHTPPFADATSESLFWKFWGLGKKSVVIDLETAEGRDAFLRLAEGADVLLESFTPGTLDQLGLGLDTLHQANPTLLVVSVTPYGQTGPDATSPATDLIVAAAGGLVGMQGDGDRPPVPISYPDASCGGAVQAAADTVCALYERDRSGLGQHLDASMQAAMVGSLLMVASYAAFNTDAPGGGDDRATPRETIPGVTFPAYARCADGAVTLTLILGEVGSRSFGRLMAWAARGGGLDDDLAAFDWSQMFPLLMGGELTPPQIARGIEQLEAYLATRTKRDIHAQALAEKWLVAPAWNSADLLADEQLAARGYWTDLDGVTYPGPFARLSETPIRYHSAAPELGAHQRLAELPHLGGPAAREPSVTVRERADDARVLDGVKVADFSWVGAGPLVSRELANHGATVVKIESELHIDPLRLIPPFQNGEPNVSDGHPMANFNQSKLGLALNLGLPEARQVTDRLVDWADIIVESFTPGTAARHGFDYETVRQKRPDIVMLSSCMRGQSGPESSYVAFGAQGAALAGFVELTGWPDRAPTGPWAAYTDFIAPRFSVAALMAALRHRERTGRGQHIDYAQAEGAIHYLGPVVLDQVINGRTAARRGLESDRACPHGTYATTGAERYVAIAVETAEQWDALRDVLDLGSAFDDPALSDLSARIERRAEIEAAVGQACAAHDNHSLAERLKRAGIPASVVARATDLATDPQLRHRGHFVPLPHPRLHGRTFEGAVTYYSATPAQASHAGPTIGQHSLEVLTNILGFTDDDVTQFAAAGVLT